MRKLITCIGVVLLFVSEASSQQGTNFTHFMHINSEFNPGAVGSNEDICAALLQRRQWSGFEGAPQVTYINANMEFNLFGLTHGAGLTIENDEIGFNTNRTISGAYAYRMELGDGQLGIGISAGIINNQLESEWKVPSGSSVPNNMFTSAEGDPAIPAGGKQNPTVFNMGGGIFYKTPKYFMGLSAKHIYTDELKYKNVKTNMYSTNYFVSGGYKLSIPNTLFQLRPSFMALTDLKAVNATLNTNVVYNKKFFGGVSYRIGNALNLLLGLKLFENARLGYSYDFEISELGSYSSGSHEIMVKYCFDLSIDKAPEPYKSIRFL